MPSICNTRAVLTSCQQVSDDFGVSHGAKNFNGASKEAKLFWRKNKCITDPRSRWVTLPPGQWVDAAAGGAELVSRLRASADASQVLPNVAGVRHEVWQAQHVTPAAEASEPAGAAFDWIFKIAGDAGRLDAVKFARTTGQARAVQGGWGGHHGLEPLRIAASNVSGFSVVCHKVAASAAVPPPGPGGARSAWFCGWAKDLVSSMAMASFGWEAKLWSFVVATFEGLLRSPTCAVHQEGCRGLGFLDIGVNIGDWITPIRLALPTVPILGVEGSPANAALAASNVAEAVLAHGDGAAVGKTEIVPFGLVDRAGLTVARDSGGLCFRKQNPLNVGAGKLADSGPAKCPASLQAGAATLGSVLRSGFPRVPERHLIAKVDIEGHELQALSTASAWLGERPPCFLMLEVQGQMSAAMAQLLVQAGYDQVWGLHTGLPPAAPFYQAGAPDPTGALLQAACKFQTDKLAVTPHNGMYYMDAVFGFRDQPACVARLLEGGP